MQRVYHEYVNKSRIFYMLEGIYEYITDEENYEDILWLDDAFEDLCDVLEENLYRFKRPLLKHFTIPKLTTASVRKNPKEIIVLLSGGKDSAAAALYYKKRGYTVHCYHATGINKAYGDERKAAESIAKYLGCDLFVDKLYAGGGTHPFIEHPLKNYSIANGAIHYALAKGYPAHLATGNFYKSKLDLNPFEVCAGDCIEMWEIYQKIVRRAIPDFRIDVPLATNADTYKILENDWKLFELAVSCMSPFRFRAHWKHRTEERYNVRLFENRCGCCWKDCVESMWLMDIGKVEYNERFYTHCFGILAKTVYKETGDRIYDIDDIWTNYMWYPITESKAYEFLMSHTLKYTTPDKEATYKPKEN